MAIIVAVLPWRCRRSPSPTRSPPSFSTSTILCTTCRPWVAFYYVKVVVSFVRSFVRPSVRPSVPSLRFASMRCLRNKYISHDGRISLTKTITVLIYIYIIRRQCRDSRPIATRTAPRHSWSTSCTSNRGRRRRPYGTSISWGIIPPPR